MSVRGTIHRCFARRALPLWSVVFLYFRLRLLLVPLTTSFHFSPPLPGFYPMSTSIFLCGLFMTLHPRSLHLSTYSSLYYSLYLYLYLLLLLFALRYMLSPFTHTPPSVPTSTSNSISSSSPISTSNSCLPSPSSVVLCTSASSATTAVVASPPSASTTRRYWTSMMNCSSSPRMTQSRLTSAVTCWSFYTSRRR